MKAGGAGDAGATLWGVWGRSSGMNAEGMITLC
jgi:hypothetical protein